MQIAMTHGVKGRFTRTVFTGRADEPCYTHISFQRSSAAILLANWTNLTKKEVVVFGYVVIHYRVRKTQEEAQLLDAYLVVATR